MAGAGWNVEKTSTVVSLQSQANDQFNLSDFYDVTRQQLRPGHEIRHAHAREH